MSTTYTGNPTATQAPGPLPGPGVVPIFQIPADTEAANVASIIQFVKESADFIAWLMQSGPGGLWFGDGSDGDVTIAADTSLYNAGAGPKFGQEVYYNNLTINAGKKLYANGVIVRVKNTLTIASGGRLQPDSLTVMKGGNGGASGVNWFTGLTGIGDFRGGNGGNNTGVNTPDNASNSVGGSGGDGAAGSSGTARQTKGIATFTVETPRKFMFGGGYAGGQGAWLAFRGGAGGGCGGGTVGSGFGGGGGGAGGAPLLVFARRLVIADNLAIQSVGGDGGDGLASGPNTGGGGGGGGGGGVFVAYGTKSGPALISNCVTGGTGGTGFGGFGSNGSFGTLVEFPLGL